jgi:hypothetical protein
MNENPILKYVHGIPIRARNKVYIDFHYREYEKLALAAVASNTSISNLVRMMTSPCQKCGHDKIELPLTLIQIKQSDQGQTIVNKYANDKEHP